VQKVHLAPLWSVVAGVAGLALIDRLSALSAAGWCAGLLYLGVSNGLLARGLRRSRTARFGPANATTAARSTLVGLVTAMVATSLTAPVSVALLLALAVPALALDAVDGWLARRTNTTSELGARFDMEVDAFLLLVLSAYLAPQLGWWVIAIGMLRYAFVAVGWMLPWMLAALPPRYWRKIVTAVAGIALAAAASELMPRWADYAVTLIALGLLLESFGRDVIWLVLRHRDAAVTEPEPSESIEGRANPQA
jgi:phosphatidylglycerophosphate synthase